VGRIPKSGRSQIYRGYGTPDKDGLFAIIYWSISGTKTNETGRIHGDKIMTENEKVKIKSIFDLENLTGYPCYFVIGKKSHGLSITPNLWRETMSVARQMKLDEFMEIK
jgi:hypothetical protein